MNQNKITKSELWNLLQDCEMKELTKKTFLLLYGAIDISGKGEISFEEFSGVIFGQEFRNILTSGGNVIGTDTIKNAVTRSSCGYNTLPSVADTSDKRSDDDQSFSNVDYKSDDDHPNTANEMNESRKLTMKPGPTPAGRNKRSVFEMAQNHRREGKSMSTNLAMDIHRETKRLSQ
jgi:hypothetical protein